MMGLQGTPARLFYDFCLEEHVPVDHMLRGIDRHLALDDLRQSLKPFYSQMGRPSVDPELMIRMLIVGYCIGIRSERRLCDEVHLNLAYRWFCRLGLDREFPITRRSRRTDTGAFARAICCAIFSRPWFNGAWRRVWSAPTDLRSTRVLSLRIAGDRRRRALGAPRGTSFSGHRHSLPLRTWIAAKRAAPMAALRHSIRSLSPDRLAGPAVDNSFDLPAGSAHVGDEAALAVELVELAAGVGVGANAHDYAVIGQVFGRRVFAFPLRRLQQPYR